MKSHPLWSLNLWSQKTRLANTRTGGPKKGHGRKQWVVAALAVLFGFGPLAGCAGPGQTAGPGPSGADLVRILGTSYNPAAQTVTVRTSFAKRGLGGLPASGENIVDLRHPAGVINYATAMFSGRAVRRVVVTNRGMGGASSTISFQVPRSLVWPRPNEAQPSAGGIPSATVAFVAGLPAYVTTDRGWVDYHASPALSSPVVGRLYPGQRAVLLAQTSPYWYQISVQGHAAYVTTNPRFVHVTGTIPKAPGASLSRSAAGGGAAGGIAAPQGAIALPPRGVTIDRTFQPPAPLSASYAAKAQAVLQVARGKLGTPYIWGHNEDRGQYGFDCSNFTEYVYHHALGYLMTTSSRGQYLYVGDPVPAVQMTPGDLLIFEQGAHVGIYAGNGQMIEEGGGLGKVGYLPVGNGSYWGKHLSSVRRLF